MTVTVNTHQKSLLTKGQHTPAWFCMEVFYVLYIHFDSFIHKLRANTPKEKTNTD